MATSKKAASKKKKAPAKNNTAAKGKSSTAAGKKKNQTGDRRNPFFMLIILVLLTVIVLLVNNFVKTGSRSVTPGKKTVAPESVIKEKIGSNEDSQTAIIEIKEKDTDKEKKSDAATRRVRVYFIKLDSRTDKMYLSSVQRKVGEQSTLRDTLNELIKGPTRQEKNRGYLTAVPVNLRIRGVRTRNRTAFVDFNSAIEYGASGNILISRLDQIVYTATQFSNINDIVITINGARRSTLGSDGLSIGGPLTRRR
jgi:spore germination protein GerM